ncbi:MAG: hypothetical protein R3D62_00225 [Xanthobacteraceae bacterium]
MEETGDAEVLDIGSMDAPWGKALLVQTIRYRSGMRIARLRIREGRRFTVLDLDETTARWLTNALATALSDG